MLRGFGEATITRQLVLGIGSSLLSLVGHPGRFQKKSETILEGPAAGIPCRLRLSLHMQESGPSP